MSFLYCLRASSKFRVSGSSDNFEVRLDPPINTSPDCCAFVSQVSIPVTWDTFLAGVNNQLAFTFEAGTTTLVQMEPGFMDGDGFCEALQSVLQYLTTATPWTVSLLPNGRVSIAWGTPEAPGLQWALLPASAIGSSSYPSPSGFTSALANHTIGFFNETVTLVEPGETFVLDAPYNSLRTSSVYLHSNLSTFSSQGPAPGDRDVICRVPVTTPWGFICNFQDSGNSHIMFPVGNQSYSKLRFWVTDSAGNPLNLRSQDVEVEVWFYDPS